MFWGGANDDSFIPLGWAAMPLLGDEPAREAWLRFYEGLEELGIFADGYCDIWPIDPLHITDYITSRGLMISFALGDPYVFERELRTTERYAERVAATNARRAQQGLAPLTGDPAERGKMEASLIEHMEAEILRYSRTHVEAYWGHAPQPDPHGPCDRAAVTAQLQDAVMKTDEVAVFGFTEARVHTDNQRGIARDALVSAALGGRVQGRAEAYPISIAASWEGIENGELARLIHYADSKKLVVDLFNFTPDDLRARLRVWRLEKGLYRISLGIDRDDDGAIDLLDGAPQVLQTEVRELARFSIVPLAVPPGRNVAMEIVQLAARPAPGDLPDLAVGQRDLHLLDTGGLEVTVHNIGAAPAEGIEVAIEDGEGRMVAGRIIERLGSPAGDFAACRARILFPGPLPESPLTVVVDPGNAIEEILEENNRRACR